MPAASPWLVRWSHLLKPGSQILDVACGTGRHMVWLAERGMHMTGIDQSAEALAQAQRFGQVVQADLENAPWPLQVDGRMQTFDAVLVTNYLWRPLMPTLLHSLRPGGLLIYETFAQGNERFGKPSRLQFLLAPGELLAFCRDCQIVAYEQGLLTQPERCVQRIVAVAPAGQPGVMPAAATEPLWLE